jgi:hypothetical protein
MKFVSNYSTLRIESNIYIIHLGIELLKYKSEVFNYSLEKRVLKYFLIRRHIFSRRFEQQKSQKNTSSDQFSS